MVQIPNCAIKMKDEVNWQQVHTQKSLGWLSRSYSSTSVHPCLASFFVTLFAQCVRSSSGPSLLCWSWPTGCLPSRLPDTPGHWGGSTDDYNRNNRKTTTLGISRVGVPPHTTWLQFIELISCVSCSCNQPTADFKWVVKSFSFVWGK